MSRRPSYEDSHWKMVAEVWNEAVAVGEPPTKAVGNAFDVSRGVAVKWVATARKRGHLPPTTRGADPSVLVRRCPTCGASPSRWRNTALTI